MQFIHSDESTPPTPSRGSFELLTCSLVAIHRLEALMLGSRSSAVVRLRLFIISLRANPPRSHTDRILNIKPCHLQRRITQSLT